MGGTRFVLWGQRGHLTPEVKWPKMVPPEGAKGSFDPRGEMADPGGEMTQGVFDPGGEMA